MGLAAAPDRNRKSASMTPASGRWEPNTRRTYSHPPAVRPRLATTPSKRAADDASASCRCGRGGGRLAYGTSAWAELSTDYAMCISTP